MWMKEKENQLSLKPKASGGWTKFQSNTKGATKFSVKGNLRTVNFAVIIVVG